MLNFDFYNPTRIIFGKNRLESIDKYVPADATVLITYGGGSAKRSGLVAALSIKLTPEEIAFLEEPYVPYPVIGFE